MVSRQVLIVLVGLHLTNYVAAASMTISSPHQTEEDLHGYVMPKQYRCDSCRAVIYHINEDLQRKAQGRRTLKEWEYTDIFDEACKTQAWSEYGVEDSNGETVLSGPGLPNNKQNLANVRSVESDQIGVGSVKMKGGKWRRRLEEFCTEMVNEVVGAKTLYEFYHEDGRLFDDEICYRDTRDCKSEETDRVLAEMDAKAGKKLKAKTKKDKKKKEKKPKKFPKVNSGLNKAHDAQTQASTSEKSGPLGVEAFLQKLATRHGVAADSYTKSRTPQAWQKLLLDVAGKVLQSSNSDL